jgi:NAD(P)-dependent dehydrogenase (short-subunit alcohol dehydrogenase family)
MAPRLHSSKGRVTGSADPDPAGRIGMTSEIAVAFLLSDAAGFMTGAELIIDAGMTRKMIYVK